MIAESVISSLAIGRIEVESRNLARFGWQLEFVEVVGTVKVNDRVSRTQSNVVAILSASDGDQM